MEKRTTKCTDQSQTKNITLKSLSQGQLWRGRESNQSQENYFGR